MQPKGLLKFLKLEGFLQNIIEYVENRIAIIKLDLKSKVGDMVRAAMVYAPIALLGLFALLFLSITLAQALNVWLDSRVWGFLIVSVLYIGMCAVLFSMRDSDWLKKKIVDGSTSFLKEKPEQENDEADANAPAGAQSDQVEHKKFIFEEAEPVTATTAGTGAAATGGAVIIDDEDLKSDNPSGGAVIIEDEDLAAGAAPGAPRRTADREPVTNTAPPRNSYSPKSVRSGESEGDRPL